jgi:hypothetical protein
VVLCCVAAVVWFFVWGNKAATPAFSGDPEKVLLGSWRADEKGAVNFKDWDNITVAINGGIEFKENHEAIDRSAMTSLLHAKWETLSKNGDTITVQLSAPNNPGRSHTLKVKILDDNHLRITADGKDYSFTRAPGPGRPGK